ncbi:probable GTP-binding protein OBGC2 [Amaranthus tricolor]|uniref:probable GTP-binding protein OBGC2 n=1 Tax=Amaranthus tricolor TaxID=29722 RepID=UPI00258C3464|nr:probable GTP-binding protein OBGC2 [Amaranthus tricolor]
MSYFTMNTSSPATLSHLHRNSHFFGKPTTSTSSAVFSDFRFTSPRLYWQRINYEKTRSCTFLCATVKVKEVSSITSNDAVKEPHKYFDHVIITVCAGDGGHGAVLKIPNQKAPSNKYDNKVGNSRKKTSFKRDSDGSIILPFGGHGGDVVIYADEGKDTLLEFHKQGKFKAKRGGNVNSMGVFNTHIRDGSAAPTLRIPVPLGTVVKRKRGKLLADLANPGDEVLVARGGQGGISLLETSDQRKRKMTPLTPNIMRDESDKVLVLGQAGEEVSLELILRVVADVGLVGLPNAGKSTLLSVITLAKPDIADYPFTTLMPNLGRLDGDPSLGAAMYSSEATLADLPGLIEGAHLGKGLGRNFLRHLRRTRLLVHVVDAAAEDPVKDYKTVKEELRMYNPDYLERPYIVVLNKIDLPQGRDRLPFLVKEILKIGQGHGPSPLVSGVNTEDTTESVLTSFEHNDSPPSLFVENKRDKEIEDFPRPLAVVGVSVLKRIHVTEMLQEIRKALQKC